MVEAIAEQVDGAHRLAGHHGRGGGPQGQRVALGVVLTEPVERPLEVLEGVLRSADRHRGLARGPAGGDRRGQVADRGGVAGQLGGGGEVGALGQHGGIRPMEAQPLARQERVGDRLAEQRVAEGVGRGPRRLEDVALDGLGERGLEGLVGQAGHPREQVVPQVLAALEGDDAQHPLRRLVELVDAGAQHAGEPTGERLAGGGARDELLGEEGIALGATGDLGDGDVVVGSPLETGHDLVHRRGRQRREVDVVDSGDARPDGQGVVERVPAVQVVGAIADDETHRRAEAAGEQQREQVAGGVVCPVHVLDDDEGGLRRPTRGEQGVDRLRDLTRVGRPTGPHRADRLRACRRRARERLTVVAGQQVAQARVRREHLVGDVGVGSLEGADELDEGEVGEGAAGLSDAVADGRRPACGRGIGEQLCEQT